VSQPNIEREWLTPEEFGRALNLILFEFESGNHGLHGRAEMWVYRTNDGSIGSGHWNTGAIETRVRLSLSDGYASADSIAAFVAAVRKHGFEPYFSDHREEGYISIAIGRNGQRRTPVKAAR
jgi:hypothetical protein